MQDKYLHVETKRNINIFVFSHVLILRGSRVFIDPVVIGN